MLTRSRRRPLDRSGRPAEARRRGGLHHPVGSNESSAMLVMGMMRRLAHAEHRREADIAAFHDPAPFVAGFGFEQRGHALFHLRPRLAVVLWGELLGLESRFLQQFLVKLRLDGAD